jgi:hypothetical protein
MTRNTANGHRQAEFADTAVTRLRSSREPTQQKSVIRDFNL